MIFSLTIILAILTLPFTLIRLLRWLAIFQQKEYRWDRLWLFSQTTEGSREILKLFPKKSELNRTGLKRPIITIRSTLGFFLSLVMVGFCLAISIRTEFMLGPIVLLIYSPFISMLIHLPIQLAKKGLTWFLLQLAKQKLKWHKPIIIGITGSYGKTSTKHLVTHMLGQEFAVFTTPRSHNTPLSVALAILRHYKKDKSPGRKNIVVLEYSAYKKGEIKRLAKAFPPHHSIITGVTPQHLGLFGSIENIIQAKGELVKATDINGVVLCNAQNEDVVKVCLQDPGKKTIAFSGKKSVVKLTEKKLDKKGRLQFSWQGHEIKTHLIGAHYKNAVQASIAAAQVLKIPNHKIKFSLENFLPEPGIYITCQQHPQQKYLVIDDGRTANPAGFEAALKLLKHFKNQGKNTVLITSGIVDLGNQSDEIHEKLAKKAKSIADAVIYPGSVGLEVFRETFGSTLIRKKQNIEVVISKLNKNDVILIEGKIPLWLEKLVLGKKK